ncbi:hypothetical protein BJX62DRAFT_243241 [Aspergillus germanicus]
MPLSPISSNIARRRVPTRTIKAPPPQVRRHRTEAPPKPQPQTPPPRENRTDNPQSETTLVTTACGCETFPRTPDLIEVTIVIWPLNVEVNVEAELDIYVYSVHPDSSKPEFGHATTHYSQLPPLERLSNFDSNMVDDFLDDAEDALEELIKQMAGDWDDNPENFRDAFVNGEDRVQFE